MHKFHKLLYNTMTAIVDENIEFHSPQTLEYLAVEGYIHISDNNEARITKKGLDLLGKLEEFKHNDLSRISTWIGLIVSGALSLFATIISLIALRGG